MVILLEGLNGVGKSSLARRFSDALDLPIIHFGIPPEEKVFDHFHHQLDRALFRHAHIILDRCHLSNRAYDGILGGGVMESGEWFRLDEILSRFEPVLFLMVDDPFVIWQRLQESEREDGAASLSREQLGEIQNRFHNLLRMSTIGVKASYQYSQFVDGEGKETELMEHWVKQLKRIKEG